MPNMSRPRSKAAQLDHEIAEALRAKERVFAETDEDYANALSLLASSRTPKPSAYSRSTTSTLDVTSSNYHRAKCNEF
jgi:hypothetical protein